MIKKIRTIGAIYDKKKRHKDAEQKHTRAEINPNRWDKTKSL